ncbi:MAG: hypothetical protein KH813_06810 [Negativicoccus succinicivorans]|uniref:hypothetical protein n=1 Tax=Negativicoccus succinicivorans TaxID=620903 RepID=UPI0026EC4488|nr:hypothetical protein [Negativicoccus succinicivorans]MBS6029110.1 hypothetical protein [Negativicoccus succinicivorans]MDU5530519.1 hypothetical protein [Negativicoccus succinicivorans]MDU5591237.1 hypothetical protein [Escherichia coli]
MEFDEDLDFNETRKQLNRELKKVARGGHSPSQALECLYLMWGALLDECTDNSEIMVWTAKMISECAKWQDAMVLAGAVETALLKAVADSQCFNVEAEEQDDE